MAHRPSSPRQRATTRTGSVLNTSQLPSGPILPQSTCSLVEKIASERRHAGLQLDKLSSAGKQEKQREALEKVARTLRDNALLRKLLDRRTTMLEALGARWLSMTTRGSLTLHLSRSGALENAGIALHPVYGFVYLPGSGIKGLTRAWAETVWAPAQADQGKAWRQIEETFGWSPGSEGHKQDWRPKEVTGPEEAAAGRLVFHDALPTRWPRLILDVVNNHHDKYYADNDDPGDWENPIPVYFLAVGGDEEFEFALSDRKRGNDRLLETARGWLREALAFEGAGAKTAAGYGRFKSVAGEQASIPATLASTTYELRLASPAFLAGAEQKPDDCDLRPATLRGLLRWWWRTMHSAHLSRDTLKKLEPAVWGDAQSGSPVRIAVDFIEGGSPRQHPDKRDQQFQQDHGLRRPHSGQKVTQGLFYASYGMAEKDRRWFLPAGSLWRVTLTAKSGRFDSVPLTPQQLLEQATAALWLLTQFGGAGSRSRKGFGSFDDIEVPGIDSKEDCIAVAAKFREHCELGGQQALSKAPALEEALILPEQSTAWADPWYAIDQTGMVLQRFAKNLKAANRIALGLPRSVGGDKQSAEKGDRYASPALWSLATREDGTLVVRLIAFPAAYLPDKATSKTTLQQLIDFARQELRRQADQSARPSGSRGRGLSHSGRTNRRDGRGLPSPPPRPSQTNAKAGDRVEADLLEEKTRKGGWKAKHLDSGLEGPIQDPQNAPADAEPGQRVQLTVASVSAKEMAFRWAEPPSPKKKPNRNGVRTPQRGRR